MDALLFFHNYPDQWDTIVALMDDEIREEVHMEFAPCSNLRFLVEYCDMHREKFGEDFEIN